MEHQKKVQDLFDLKVRQCNHMLNYDYHIDKDIKQIPLDKRNLFLGGVGSFKQAIIDGYRITSVLSILDNEMMQRYMIKQKIEHMRIQSHKWIDLEDQESSKISVYFNQTHQFIKQMLKQHNVLIHCQVGVSRSASITIAFFMKQFHLKFIQAFQIVKKRRSLIQPNQGFVKELLLYEAQLFSL